MARPLATFVTLAPFRFNTRENLYIAWMGLRGAVPIILALFPVMAGVPQSFRVFEYTFVIVLLSLLVQAHGRSLQKIARQVDEFQVGWDLVFSLRLAALFCRSRTDVAPSSLQVKRQGKRFRVSLGKEWLRRNPLTATALLDEVREWEAIGFELRIPELVEFEAAGELALAG